MKRYRLNKIGIIIYLIRYILVITLLDILCKYSITNNINLTPIHIYFMNIGTLLSKLFIIQYYKMIKEYTFN